MNPSIYTVQTSSNTSASTSHIWVNPHQSYIVQPQATPFQPLPAIAGQERYFVTQDPPEPDPAEVERMIDALLGMRRKLQAA